MSRENIELVYRGYDALRRGDADAFLSTMHPDVEGMSHVMAAEGRVFRGRAGVRQFLDDLFIVFPDWHPEVTQALDYGDVVIAEIRMAGRGASSGVELQQTAWQAIRFCEGQAIWWRGFATKVEALEAVGLRE